MNSNDEADVIQVELIKPTKTKNYETKLFPEHPAYFKEESEKSSSSPHNNISKNQNKNNTKQPKEVNKKYNNNGSNERYNKNSKKLKNNEIKVGTIIINIAGLVMLFLFVFYVIRKSNPNNIENHNKEYYWENMYDSAPEADTIVNDSY